MSMEEITEGPLLAVRDGYAAKLIFNRPEKKNALSAERAGTMDGT
jgi:hypothetical protein